MESEKRVVVNFFAPSNRGLASEIAIIKTTLFFWALISFGIPLLIWLAGLGQPGTYGESFLTRTRFLGFPLHYWLLAQGATIGFLVLCKFYCVLWDNQTISRKAGEDLSRYE